MMNTEASLTSSKASNRDESHELEINENSKMPQKRRKLNDKDKYIPFEDANYSSDSDYKIRRKNKFTTKAAKSN